MLLSRALPFTLAVFLGASTVHAKVTKGPWVQRVRPTSAVIRVEVNPAAAVSLEVTGLTGADGGLTVLESKEAKTLHELPLDQLQPGTHYRYLIKTGGQSKLAAFTTALADDSSASFRFLAYGDNRTDDAAHASVVRAMVPVPSDFLVHTGDFVENGASLPQWQTFFDIEAPLLNSRPIVSAVGNHELVDNSGINYVKFFGPPVDGGAATKPEHLDHTFRWGNTRFFFLNGLSQFKTGVERQWLDKVLADADNEDGLMWRVVVVHHGPWSSGPHGGNQHFHEAGLPAMFKQHKVDVVFSGHDHTYERGIGDGLPFVVTGGGGAPLYRLRNRIPQSRHSESTHHFVHVEVNPRVMQITALRTDGSRIERCALSKATEGWFCGDVVELLSDGGVPPPTVAPEETPPPGARSRCSCEAVGAESSISRGLSAAAFAFPLIAYLRRRRRY